MNKPEKYQEFLTELKKVLSKKFKGRKMVASRTIREYLAKTPNKKLNRLYKDYLLKCKPDHPARSYYGNWPLHSFSDRVVRNVVNSGVKHQPQYAGKRSNWSGRKVTYNNHYFNF